MRTSAASNPAHRARQWLVSLACVAACGAVFAGPRDDPPVDLANLPPGQGAVFFTLDVQWPEQPAIAKANVAEKVVEVYSLQKLQDPKHVQKPDLTLFPKVGSPKAVLRTLPAGRYEFTCLYLRDLMFMRPVGSCYPLEIVFDVAGGEVTYAGRLVLTMPKEAMSTRMKVQVVDDRAVAISALSPAQAERLAAAPARLAAPVRIDEHIEFSTSLLPRLEAALKDESRVHQESHKEIGLSIVRFVLEGRDAMDWKVALEILQSQRVNEPQTPAAWLQRYRETSDTLCPSEWQTLAEAADSVMFERHSPDCPPHAAQQAVHRMVYGAGGAWHLICTQKGRFDPQTQQECRALLESAKVVAD